MGRLISLTNQRFGRWTALRHLGAGQWECRCRCGVRGVVNSFTLRSGRSTSCGCLADELLSARQAKDITGQRFGRLTALSRSDLRTDGSVVWRLRCDCGHVMERPAKAVISGHVKSCGCLQKDTPNATKATCKHGHPLADWNRQPSPTKSYGQCYMCSICRGREIPFDTDQRILKGYVLAARMRALNRQKRLDSSPLPRRKS